MWISNNAAHIAYTRQGTPSSMRFSKVWPLPDPDRYYLFPRSNTPRSVAPAVTDGAIEFRQMQRIETRWAKHDNRDVSVGMWVRLTSNGVLFDARKGRAGLLFQLKANNAGMSPAVYLSTKERDIVSSLIVPVGEWCYLGMSVDNRSGNVRFFVNGMTDTKSFTAPADLAGDTVYFGYKRVESSRCTGLCGDIRWAAIYDGVCMLPAQHGAVFNSLAKKFGSDELYGDAPLPEPSFELDPSKPDWQQRLVEHDDAAMRVRSVERDGRTVVRFNGEASASVDLDRNRPAEGDLIEFEFAFKLDSIGAGWSASRAVHYRRG